MNSFPNAAVYQYDQQAPRSASYLPNSSKKTKKKLLSFFSDRRPALPKSISVTTTSTSSSTAYSSSSSSSTLTPLSSLVYGLLDNDDYHFLRKSLSRFQNKVKQRQDILKHQVLPCFKKPQSVPKAETSTAKDWDQARSILLRWWSVLISQVQHINYSERTVYFECIVEIMARPEFIDYDYTDTTFGQWYAAVDKSTSATRSLLEEYKHLLMITLRYAMDKLNHKAIYSNLISFCAKILAFGFIKIPGLAVSLLQTLSVKNTIMKQIVTEMGEPTYRSEYKSSLSTIFPAHLEPIMTWNLTQYKQHIEQTKQQRKAPIASTGNWLRRWQSDDSELFFSFYRHYHVTLKTYITAIFPSTYKYDLHQRNALLAVSPGYVYLAAYFAGKIEGLLNRRLHSVTTILQQSQSPQGSVNRDKIPVATGMDTTELPNNVQSQQQQQQNPSTAMLMNANDSDDVFIEPGDVPLLNFVKTNTGVKDQVPLLASPSGEFMNRHLNVFPPSNGKPKLLEMATQRYAECLVWCIMISEQMGLYHDMINVWMRTMIRTTSMMSVESVFSLLDFIEILILETQHTRIKLYHHQQHYVRTSPSLDISKRLPPLDIPFLLYTLQVILSQSDHTITLLRSLAFVYTHFHFLTADAALLDLMGNHILLATPIFERLFLHWGRNVRIFYLRCLIWRMGRLWKNINWSSLLTLLRTDKETESCLPASHTRVCNGMECLESWHQTNHHEQELHRPEYSRCALQLHILLETTLDAFRQRYMELEKTPMNEIKDNNDTPYITRAAGDNAALSLGKGPFQSHVSSSPITQRIPPSIPPTSPCTGDDKKLEDQPHQYSPKTRRKSSLFKKHHLFAKPSMVINSKTSKEKWMTLFSFASSSHRRGNTTVPKILMKKSINNHNSVAFDCKNEHNNSSNYNNNDSLKYTHGFYYTVPRADHWNTTSLAHIAAAGRHASMTHNDNKEGDDHIMKADVKVSIQDDVLSEHGSHFASTTLSTEKDADDGAGKDQAHDTNDGDDNNDSDEDGDSNDRDADDEDEDDNDQDDNGTVGTSPASSTFLPSPVTVIRTVKTWKYSKTKHVYASNTLRDLKIILHEHFMWTDKNTITKLTSNDSNLSSDYRCGGSLDIHVGSDDDIMNEDENERKDRNERMIVPALTLDWPKNWSYSQL